MVLNTTFMSGVPMTVPNNVYVLRDPSLSNASFNQRINTGIIQANGTIVNQIGDLAPAFQIMPAFTLRTASQYFPNIRNLWGKEYNVSLAKKTRIREGMSAQFRAEIFNLTNHPIFPNDPVLDGTSPNFGRVIRDNGQTNVPRQIELALRFEF